MIKTNITSLNNVRKEDRFEPLFYLEYEKLCSEHVELEKIDNLKTKISNGATPYGPAYTKDGVKFFRANDVKFFQIDLMNHKYISEEDSKILKRSLLKKEDVVITIKGKIGAISVVPEMISNSNINQDCAVIHFDERVNPYYFAALFNSNFGQLQLKRYATSTINPFLGLGNLKEIEIPLFKKEIQDKIGDYIKTAEEKFVQSYILIKEAIAQFEEVVGISKKDLSSDKIFTINYSDLKEMWNSTFYLPKYVSLIELLKKKHKCISLSIVVDRISKGNEVGSVNYNKYFEKEDNFIPFVRTSDLVNYEIDSYPDFYLTPEIAENYIQDIKEGDLLISNDGKIGLTAFVTKEDKCIFQSHIRRIRLNKDSPISDKYLFVFLNSFLGQYQLKKFTLIQSTIPTLSNRLNDLIIPIIKEDRLSRITQIIEKAIKLKEERKILLNKAKLEVEKIVLG